MLEERTPLKFPFTISHDLLSVFGIDRFFFDRELFFFRTLEMDSVFRSALNTAEGELEIAINLYLLELGLRDAFLLESANFADTPGLADQARQNILRKYDGRYLMGNETEGKFWRFIIANPRKRELFDRAMDKDETALGKLLGFNCPGQLGSEYLIKTTAMYGDSKTPISIIVEMCRSPPDEAWIQRRKSKLAKAALPNLSFDVKVEYVPNQGTLSSWIMSDDVKQLWKNKDKLVNIFDDWGYLAISEDILSNQTFADFKRWWDRHGRVMKVHSLYFESGLLDALPWNTDQYDQLSASVQDISQQSLQV